MYLILLMIFTLQFSGELTLSSYVGISQDGKISGWRNAAVDNSAPTAWTPFRGIASGLSATYSPSRWRFADLKWVQSISPIRSLFIKSTC